MIDEERAYLAVTERDKAQDGRFVFAVRTTGVYCKPSCAARRPKRENVEFFDAGASARAAGYRACMRCKPDEAGREALAVDAAELAGLIAERESRDAKIAILVGQLARLDQVFLL